jgi:hypothetical protein
MRKSQFVAILCEWIKAVAREAFHECVGECYPPSSSIDTAPAKLPEQIALIKSKENITVKEAALLLSCPENYVRKLVKLALKGKSSHSIPSVSMEGITVVIGFIDYGL